jgi:hypothetical protein
MTRQEQKVNLEYGRLYYVVTFQFTTDQLLPTELYEEINEMIEAKIISYEQKEN